MSDTLTPERIAELRAIAAAVRKDSGLYSKEVNEFFLTFSPPKCLALLAAAEECATLRAEVERVTDIAAMKAEVWDQNITALRAENARLRDLLARVQVEDRWRPIDTAPKDGTPIMVLRGQWMAIAWWGKTINGHMAWCHDAGFFPSWDLPTHYRPKPLTPAEEAELDALRAQNEEAMVAENVKLQSLLHRVKRVLPPGELYEAILSVLHEEKTL